MYFKEKNIVTFRNVDECFWFTVSTMVFFLFFLVSIKMFILRIPLRR
jgi:hypothetical protein